MKLHIKEMNGIRRNAYSLSRRLYNAIYSDNESVSGIILFPEESDDKITGECSFKAGTYFKGVYIYHGICYSEKSLSFEITGVKGNELIETAEKICRDFKQKYAILKDYSAERIVFIETE